jgi:chromosome segregation ATPase
MLGLTTTRRLRAELAAAKAETDRQRERAETAEKNAATAVFNRRQALRQLAEADATNRRLNGRVLELGRRLTELGESDPEYTAALEARLDRALTACARWMTASWGEARRNKRLQQRYYDAVGLSAGRIADSSSWQPGNKKPKETAS